MVVPPAGYLRAAREITTRARRAAVARRGADRHRPDRARGSPTQTAGVAPDVVTLAKGLGGGIPIGACIALGEAGDLLSPATTAPRSAATRSPAPPPSPSSTPSRRTACSTTSPSVGERLRDGLAADPRVTEVRGRGPADRPRPATPIVAPTVAAAARAHGFIVNAPTPGP